MTVKSTQLSFSEFKDIYKHPLYRRTKPVWKERGYSLAFRLHLKAGDEMGYFGKGKGTWCLPWNWYKVYYRNRFPLTKSS